MRKFELIPVNVYIPPNTSLYYNSDSWTYLEVILDDISTLYPQSIIILLGDFNAKLGPSLHVCSKERIPKGIS